MQGLFLFGINYWLTYTGIENITSALAAIVCTSIMYFNIIFGRIFLGDNIRPIVAVGATIGLLGVSILLVPEFVDDSKPSTLEGVLFALAACVFASLGSIVSAATRRRNIPIIQLNALGMGYAATMVALLSLVIGYEFNLEFSYQYIGSLLYLSIFGSIIAFGAFIKLVGQIGPDKAGYITFVFPVIAILLSALFEGYQLTLYSLFGLLIILCGNFIAMEKHTALLSKFKNKLVNIES